MEKPKRLYRSKTNRVFFGVCGGLAEFMEIDPIIIRIIFVLLALMPGFGTLLYIIGIFIIPEETTLEPIQPDKKEAEQSEKPIKDEFHQKIDNAVDQNPQRLGSEQIIGLIIYLSVLAICSAIIYPG